MEKETRSQEISINVPSIGVLEGKGNCRGLHAIFREEEWEDGSKHKKKVISTKSYIQSNEEAEEWFYENLADQVEGYLPDSLKELIERD